MICLGYIAKTKQKQKQLHVLSSTWKDARQTLLVLFCLTRWEHPLPELLCPSKWAQDIRSQGFPMKQAGTGQSFRAQLPSTEGKVTIIAAQWATHRISVSD